MSCWWIIRLNISEFHYYDITILCSPTVHDSMKYSWTVFSLVESERQTSNSEGCLFFILIQTSSGNLLLGHLKAGFPFSHNCHIFFDCFYLSAQVTIILSSKHIIIRFYENLSKHGVSCKKRPKSQDFFGQSRPSYKWSIFWYFNIILKKNYCCLMLKWPPEIVHDIGWVTKSKAFNFDFADSKLTFTVINSLSYWIIRKQFEVQFRYI